VYDNKLSCLWVVVLEDVLDKEGEEAEVSKK
jgi:hypothetical protein